MALDPDKPLPLVVEEKPTKLSLAYWLPQSVTEHIYPAGNKKLNPDARKALEDAKTLLDKEKEGKLESDPKNSQRLAYAHALLDSIDVKTIETAEAEGARYAFRWVAVLPTVLIFIFGMIALIDRLRGGYKPVHIETGMSEEAAHS
jgi:hypothetical protein